MLLLFTVCFDLFICFFGKKSESIGVCGYFKRFIQFLVSFVVFICVMVLLYDQIVRMDSDGDSGGYSMNDNIGKMDDCYSVCQ